MLAIKCSQRGFLTGFENNCDPVYGSKDDALPFKTNIALELCFELDNPELGTISTVTLDINGGGGIPLLKSIDLGGDG